MSERYFITRPNQPECEVSKAEFVKEERAAGFINSLGEREEPATAGFGKHNEKTGEYTRGRVVHLGWEEDLVDLERELDLAGENGVVGCELAGKIYALIADYRLSNAENARLQKNAEEIETHLEEIRAPLTTILGEAPSATSRTSTALARTRSWYSCTRTTKANLR